MEAGGGRRQDRYMEQWLSRGVSSRKIERKKIIAAAIVQSSGGGKVSSGWFGASTARCLQNKQPSGYVDAPGPSNAHAAFGARGDGVANPPGCGLWRSENVSTTRQHTPDPPPPSRCHATDTTEHCGGVVLHVTSGIPLAAMIAFPGGTRTQFRAQMPLICLGGQICSRALGLEKSVESGGSKGWM